MRITQQPAFILHARAWRETSLLLEAFTRDHGRVGLVARGVRGAKARLPRAWFEPAQALRLDWQGRGELATLVAAEPDGVPALPCGDALLALLYVNELLVRVCPRGDAQPQLFLRYAALLPELADAAALAWNLRRFERDLLACAGYGLPLEHDVTSGAAIDPARSYVYLPEQGLLPAEGRRSGVLVSGAALLALAADRRPDAAGLAALRQLMRAAIGAVVGERGLAAWRLLAATR